MSSTRPPADDTEPLTNYSQFGPFILVEELGKGGMGRLHLARTPWPDAPVAIVKSLPAGREGSFVSVERFRHEAELLVRLEHENLAATYHVGRVRDALYVAVEPVLGRDALDVARRSRDRGVRVPPEVVLPVIRDVLRALVYIHAAPVGPDRPAGILHRDVTPGNVIIGYDGTTKLVDFGIAKSSLTERYDLTRDFVIGTPSYLAPEIVLGDPPSAAADVYGAGAVAYRLLTGAPPFSGKGTEVLVKAVSERPRPLDQLRPDLPANLVALVERMMAPSLAARFKTSAAALSALDAISAPRAYEDRIAVAQWMRMVFQEQRSIDAARLDAVRAVPYPEESAWTSEAAKFVHDEAQPTLAGSEVETDLELSGDAVAAWLEPSSGPADATILESPAVDDPSEFDETIQPSANDWHIAREADAEVTVEPPAPTVAMTPRSKAKPAALAEQPRIAPAAPRPPLSLRTVVVLIVLASAVSGLVGAVLALYFAQGR